jgi:hypothetical protein
MAEKCIAWISGSNTGQIARQGDFFIGVNPYIENLGGKTDPILFLGLF